jgi:hypothetical protein
MATPANLDALIPREDFEVDSDANVAQSVVDRISITNLQSTDFFYFTLRKPDFQRETADWNPRKIAEFVQSFLDGDLIPAIILWHSGSNNFVIDGAHRLSALIAWVNDDYGDKAISRKFFEDRIADEQLEVAENARKMIRKAVGTYEDHKLAVQIPEKFKPETLVRAKRLATLALQLQWVKGDASKAEASFFKINQQAAPIDPTELKLLKARKSPNAMAARAIIRSGTGHKYWSKFYAEIQTEIQDLAKSINSALFVPKLTTPIKTLDLPVAGRGYSGQTLPLIFELVNLANNLGPKDVSPADPDGRSTIAFLKNTRRIVDRISGNHPSSLGLHPAVYFYSETGRYQPTAFLAIARFIQGLDGKNEFRDFTDKREQFETFLLAHKIFSNQVTIKYGSGVKGFAHLCALYRAIFDLLLEGKTAEQILIDLAASGEFSYLQPSEKRLERDAKDFDPDTKSAAFLREALSSPIKCKICGGLIHAKSISIDHILRKADGGVGDVANAQVTHPYCNTTVKN